MPWRRNRGSVLGSAVVVVAWRAGWCNADMAGAWRELGIDATLVSPARVRSIAGPGDVALNRLDVSARMDGVEPGLGVVAALERAGVRVLNRPAAMLIAHDKLAAARRMESARVAQPQCVDVPYGARTIDRLDPPLVLKPRFGSWGRDVLLCRTRDDVARALAHSARLPWFARGGAVAQSYVPHTADLRLVLAAGELVGSIERRPAPREWRTNFSLGGSRRPVVPSGEAVETARAAAAAVGTDLVGVDLVAAPGGYLVIEVNGAVDFDRLYSLPGRDAYRDVADLLAFPVTHAASRRSAVRLSGPARWLPATRWQTAAWR